MSKRGRPSKDNSSVQIKHIIVEYLATTYNGFKPNICYFKVVDKYKNKMKPITCLSDDELRMPYWKSDKQELLLKVKEKCLVSVDEPVRGSLYLMDAEFESYCFEKVTDGTVLKGYTVKVPMMKAFNPEVECVDDVESS